MSSENSSPIVGEANLDFYDIVARYLSTSSQSARPQLVLKDLVNQYPEHAADLVDFAYARLLDKGGLDESASEAQQEAVIDTARQLLLSLSTPPAPLKSLTAAAKEVGKSSADLAKSIRLDLVMVAKLEQRLLDVSTIPDDLLTLLAANIKRTVADVRSYLLMPPRLVAGAQYRSKSKPTIQGLQRQSFTLAMTASKTIAQEDRIYWQDKIEATDDESYHG